VKVDLFRPDGTTCGWYTPTIEPDAGALSVLYDPDGREVARQQLLMPSELYSAVRYTCDGQEFVVTSEQRQASVCQRVQAHDCPAGICP